MTDGTSETDVKQNSDGTFAPTDQAKKFRFNNKDIRRLIIVVAIISLIGVAEFTLFVYGQFSDIWVDENPVLTTELEETGIYGADTANPISYENYTIALKFEILNRGRIPAADIEISSWLVVKWETVQLMNFPELRIEPETEPDYKEIGVLEIKKFNITFHNISVYEANSIEFHLEVFEEGEVTERVNATLKPSGSYSFVIDVELEVEDLVQRNSSIFFIAVGIEGVIVLVTILLSIFITGDHKLALAVSALGLAPLFRIVNVATPVALDFLVFVTMSYGFLLVAVFIFVYVNKIPRKDLGVTFKKMYFWLPIAVLFGFLLAPLEFLILGPPPWIPKPTIFNIFVLTLVMIFFVGLAEELMFRAIIQTSLDRLLSPKLGLFLTALLFGLMHGVWTSYLELVFTFAAGLLFGYLFQRTRNLPFISVLHGVEDVILFGLLPFIM